MVASRPERSGIGRTVNVGSRGAGPRFLPTRPRRLRWALVLVGALVLAALALTAWLDRTEVRRFDLGDPAVVVVENQAGPVEVIPGDGPVVAEATASYLATAPTLTRTEPAGPDDQAGGGGRVGVRATCPGWGPCRVALIVSVPPDTAVEAVTGDGSVSVGAVRGSVSVTTGDGPVHLGPIAGSLRVRTEGGPVRATDLRSPEVEVDSASGPVELTLGGPHQRVDITAATAVVRLTLPLAAYHLDLRGKPLDRSGLLHPPPVPVPAPGGDPDGAATVVPTIRVHSGGPVTVATGGPGGADGW